MNNIISILSVVSLGMLAACGAAEDVGSSTGEASDSAPGEAPVTELRSAQSGAEVNELQDGEEQYGEGVTALADVRVVDSRFVFVELTGPDGAAAGVGTIEQVGPNTRHPRLDSRFANASPLDLYLAITTAETAVPEALEAYEDHQLGERGWFLEHMALEAQSSPRAICNNTDFRADLRTWIPEVNDEELWRLDTGVSDGSDWTGPVCGTALGCDNPSFYSLYNNSNSWSITNVDEMKQQIDICAMNPSRTVCSTFGGCISHLGPTVSFQYRTESNASVGSVFTRDMTATDVATRWAWVWWGSAAAGDHNWDWRIRINQVKQGDLFDLGWISEHRGW